MATKKKVQPKSRAQAKKAAPKALTIEDILSLQTPTDQLLAKKSVSLEVNLEQGNFEFHFEGSPKEIFILSQKFSKAIQEPSEYYDFLGMALLELVVDDEKPALGVVINQPDQPTARATIFGTVFGALQGEGVSLGGLRRGPKT